MNKRLFCLAFILAVLCVLLPTAAFAADSGTCGAEGDNLTWTLDDTGLLGKFLAGVVMVCVNDTSGIYHIAFLIQFQ